MDALKSLVQPLVGGAGGSSVIDGMKLVVLGGTVETARRASSSAWSHFLNSFFLTAHFSEEDYPYDWLMLWLSRRPEWQRSREFETTTRTTTPGFSGSRQADNSFGDDEEEEGDEDSPPGKVKTRVVFQPTFDTTHTIYYKGHWLRVRRSKKQDGSGCEVLSISVVARNNTILKQLVLQAKKEYEAEAIHRIQIYFADSHGSWRWTDSRHKRPMSSIVLNPGVKEMLLNDTRDFLKSEKWYADRGIPFRRGYLLHGVPGSGKSSLIHAIAGELMLDIYVVSLSSSWISDSTLTTLMGRVPARCIVLLEDLDAAFTRSVTRDKGSNGTPDSSSNSSEEGAPEQPVTSSSSRHRRHKDHISDVNTLSLSGLLNALDGVAAAEGRILFATTNHLERLDPALSASGPYGSEALFRNFFPSTDQDNEVIEGDIEGIDLPTTPTPQSSSPSPSSQILRLLSLRETALVPRTKRILPPPVEEHLTACQHSAKPLDGARLAQLAKMFADSIPDDEFSVAALQGYLLKNKSQPEAAANGAAAWVISERELRERLRKEKEAREIKEKLDREKRRKELLEKEKEKAELEKKELELAKLRQQLQEQEAKDKAEADKKDGVVPIADLSADDNKGEPSTDDDSDEENVPPPSTPPEAVWIQVADSKPTAAFLHEDPLARDVTQPTQAIIARPAQMANVLTMRHAGGFTLVYYMFHFYFIHLYAMLLHLNPVGRRRQA
ncbi:P-loop containing nucleoside triphosphate hydrolase protein [Suillus occidentalis]|nr:P-loop containing nucleoside triphosphate hydrolase protein [Suillus occidentalis]